MGWGTSDSPEATASSRALAASAEKLERDYAAWAERYDAPDRGAVEHDAPADPFHPSAREGRDYEGYMELPTSRPERPAPVRGMALSSTGLREDGQFRASVSSLDSEEEDFNKFCARVAATITGTRGPALDRPASDEVPAKGCDSDGKDSAGSVEVRVMLEGAERQVEGEVERPTRLEAAPRTDYFSRSRPIAGGEYLPAAKSTAAEQRSAHSSPAGAAEEEYLHAASPPRPAAQWLGFPGGADESAAAAGSANPASPVVNTGRPAAWDLRSDPHWESAKILVGDDGARSPGSEKATGDTFEFRRSSSPASPPARSGGWALTSLASEERALEADLAGIDAKLLGKPRRAVQELASEAVAEVDSLLGRSGDDGSARRLAVEAGDGEWWRYGADAEPWQPQQQQQQQQGPREYVSGQARSEDMYVPSGGASRHRSPARSRSPSPAPSALSHQGSGFGLDQMNVSGGVALSRASSAGPYELVDGRPKAARRGREELDSRVADRMYRQAVELGNRKEWARRSAVQEAAEAALRGCTFKPSINRRSADMAKQTTPRHRAERVEAQLHRELDEAHRHVHCSGNPCGPSCPKAGDAPRRGRSASAPRERAASARPQPTPGRSPPPPSP